MPEQQRPCVIQVVARLPPRIDGVGDYSWRLGAALKSAWGIDSRYLVCSDPDFVVADSQSGLVTLVDDQTKSALLSCLHALARQFAHPPLLVLHYVGYGYDRNGAPEWLVSAFEEFSKGNAHIPLVCIFHELFASSVPWRKAFWYSASQKSLARRLLGLSTEAMCTIEKNERELRSWSSATPITRIAIPSGFGEPPAAQVKPWAQRRNVLVIAGLPANRERAYRDKRRLERTCCALGITEIMDIGPPVRDSQRFASARVTCLGAMSSESASQVLLESRYAYLYYPADYLAKSSMFAAYCAHGLATVLPMRAHRSSDGLVPGRHFVSADDIRKDGQRGMEDVATHAHAWYGQHDMGAHAAWLAGLSQRLT